MNVSVRRGVESTRQTKLILRDRKRCSTLNKLKMKSTDMRSYIWLLVCIYRIWNKLFSSSFATNNNFKLFCQILSLLNQSFLFYESKSKVFGLELFRRCLIMPYCRKWFTNESANECLVTRKRPTDRPNEIINHSSRL